MRRAALLLLLAFAAVSASARNLHGLTTSTTAGEGDSTPEAVPMETKGLFEDVLEYFETAGEVVGDYVAGFFGSEVCLYGNNCGMNCVHDTYDPEDPLDYACWVHDRCLADDVEDDCACDDALIAAANEIYYTADPESDMGRTAATVADGISALGKAMHGCYW